MLWALVAPELIINWAVRQWIGARRLQRKFSGVECVEWTNTHGHFLQMGGFMLMDSEYKKLGVIDAWKLESLLAEGKIDFPRITREEIEDHSSSDVLSNCLAIGQAVWFIVQCIARKRQGLFLTELELVTLAFAALNTFIYIMWWDKPQNVECPVPVYLRLEAGPKIFIPEWKPTTWSDYKRDTIAHFKAWFSAAYRSLTSTDSAGSPDEVTYGTRLSRKLSVSLNILHAPSAFIGAISSSLRDLLDKHNVEEGDMGVSKFYTFYSSHRVYQARFYAFSRDVPTSTDVLQLVTTFLIGTLFGGIHCFGWDFESPSYAEHILWKICSLASSCIPLIRLLFIVSFTWQSKFRASTTQRGGIAQGFVVLVWVASLLFGLVGVPVYILARLGLLTEAFIALRAAPEGAYENVQWTLLLPHIQI